MSFKNFNLRAIVENVKVLRNFISQGRKYTTSVRINPVVNNPYVGYQVRAMKEEDIPQVMERRRELGMFDCQSCIQSWHKLDPEGISVAVRESGEVIGLMSCIVYPDDFAYWGLFYVKKEFRGQGVGAKVWDENVKHTGTRNSASYSVPQKAELFRKNYMPIMSEDYTGVKNTTPENVNPDVLLYDLPAGVEIQSFREHHLGSIFEYDFNLVGYKRSRLIELSCKEENSRTFVAMRDGYCVGFGTIKLSCIGTGRVGPLYADDPRVAEALLKVLILSFPKGYGFSMATLSNNIFSSSFLHKLCVPAIQHLPQLFSRKQIIVNTAKVFAVFDINGAPF